MANNRDGPSSSVTEFNAARRRAGPTLSELCHSTPRVLQWWRRRQQQRQELQVLCAREFAAHSRPIRTRRP